MGAKDVLNNIYDYLVLDSSKFRVGVIFKNALPFPLLTLKGIDWSVTTDVEPMYIVGQTEAAALIPSKTLVSGTLKMQYGEYGLMLKAAGVFNASEIQNAVIVFTSILSLTSSFPSTLTISGITFNEVNASITAPETESIVNVSFKGLGFLQYV